MQIAKMFTPTMLILGLFLTFIASAVSLKLPDTCTDKQIHMSVNIILMVGVMIIGLSIGDLVCSRRCPDCSSNTRSNTSYIVLINGLFVILGIASGNALFRLKNNCADKTGTIKGYLGSVFGVSISVVVITIASKVISARSGDKSTSSNVTGDKKYGTEMAIK